MPAFILSCFCERALLYSRCVRSIMKTVRGFDVAKLKRHLLWLVGKLQREAEQNFGLIGSLFLLNYFSIFWLNIHMYQWEQLGVVVMDGLFLFAMTGLYVSLLSLLPVRWLRSLLLVLSFAIPVLLGALDVFSIISYEALVGAGVVTAMMQTNSHEAVEFLIQYVGWRGLAVMLLAGLAMAFAARYVVQWRLRFPSRHWRTRIFALLFACGLVAGIGIWEGYHSFVIGDYLDISAVRMARSVEVSFQNIEAYEKLSKQMESTARITENRSDIPQVVFILGEATARQRMHLYGYELENTPLLEELADRGELAVFRDVIAPQGATVAVLQELFTFADAESDKEWYEYNNLIDVLNLAGYRTYWLSNQESSGIWGNVAQFYARRSSQRRFTEIRESHEEHGTLDEELFPLLEQAMADPGEKKFYVLHLMGGHSLYYMRFPYLFSKFGAEDVPMEESQLSEEKRLEVAQYANALYYNDYVVRQIVERFREQDAIVIYLPDHGEALYDHGSSVSGHVQENPNRYMLEVPMIFWASEEFKARRPEKWQAICGAVDRPYMTDDMIHTVLDLMDIRTEEFDASKSLLSPSFKASRQRIVQGRNYDMDMK